MEHDPQEQVEGDRARREDLAAIAREQEAAAWGTDPGTRSGGVGVGLLMGELGPKGTVGAQLRSVTRAQRQAGREVPFGTSVPGSGRYLFAFVGLVALAGLGVVVLLGWLTAQP